MMRTGLIELTYLASSILFILGLNSLTKTDQARRGMQLAALGMLLAVVGTLLKHEIIDYRFILLGSSVGAVLGWWLGSKISMTAMPQGIAISHGFGALAATLVGIAEYVQPEDPHLGAPKMAALGFEVLFGSLTVTGSIMAFAKLQELMPGRPMTFKGQNLINLVLFTAAFGLFLFLTFSPDHPALFYAMMTLGLLMGVLLVLPIGAGDMPVVVSLLNSYAGLACAATGFAIENKVLLIAGALNGASGFLLSVLMSKAMNRSFSNVLFGAFGSAPAAGAVGKTVEGLEIHTTTIEEAALQLAYARRVIVVPGYWLAVAQSQHQVRELAELIEKKGGEVRYAIHPVSGRMPGHMNVLLAEANVPYDQLFDLDDINSDFDETDVALVIGANDVVNPAARTDPASPIYGMPILNVDHAKNVIVLKRGMTPGFAGIENELFYQPNTKMLFGDAKKSLTQLVSEVKAI